MARAKVRPTYRRSTGTTRRCAPYPPHSVPQRRSLARWAIVAGVVLVLILIFFVGPIIRDAALDLRETLVRFFGLGVLLLEAGLLANAWLVLAKQFHPSAPLWPPHNPSRVLGLRRLRIYQSSGTRWTSSACRTGSPFSCAPSPSSSLRGT